MMVVVVAAGAGEILWGSREREMAFVAVEGCCFFGSRGERKRERESAEGKRERERERAVSISGMVKRVMRGSALGGIVLGVTSSVDGIGALITGRQACGGGGI